jgi:KGK domain
MTDRPKQIIPDLEDITRCLDREMLKILDSHGTFTISELLETIQKPICPALSTQELTCIFKHSVAFNCNREDLFNKINNTLLNKKELKLISKILLDGIDCKLLQLDQKRWQKGKLKICFEFIPEEDISIIAQEKEAENYHSPLDEIRQLANKLASVGSIEQN